jgi:hypothetical protein
MRKPFSGSSPERNPTSYQICFRNPRVRKIKRDAGNCVEEFFEAKVAIKNYQF